MVRRVGGGSPDLLTWEACWEPIQAIRREHDRQVRRWMPHITMVYPFRPREEFGEVAGGLARACRAAEPFDLCVRQFRSFHHGRERFTVWLAPEPTDQLVGLLEALLSVVPDCEETAGHSGGFTPHLSVGQVRGRARARELLAEIQAAWKPFSFRVESVSLIWRGAPPDDVFRVDRTVGLGEADSWRVDAKSVR